eukprot:gb/GFBE01028938.1/.p1 GENE.gb/GFBE01028938.1/~~gb/GFBE01028938.1/.p1  ORF type:complete len:383 (+),score=92.61 gb/GFBE01028938.1/:1-1149(+)
MKLAACALLFAMFGAALAAKLSKTMRVMGTEITASGEPQQALLSLVAGAAHATDDTLPDVDALTKLAKSLSKSRKQEGDDAVTQIRTLVTGMIESLTAQHAAQQESLNNFTLFTTCTEAKNAGMAEAEHADTTGGYVNTTDQWLECLSGLDALNATWQSCLATQTDLRETKDALQQLFDDVDKGDNYAEWFCTGDTYEGTYRSYLERNIAMLHQYEGRRDNLTVAVDALNAKIAECSALAGPVADKAVVCAELKPGAMPVNCGPKQVSTGVCSSYDECWAQAENEAEHAFTTASAIEASLMAEYRSLKRIQCLLEVLDLADGTNQTTKLQECIDRTHSAAAMDIVQPNYPTQETCTILPCSGGEAAADEANVEDDDPTALMR